ncbi:MAG: hypothetical protein HY822_15715 [Acidobacteria bacterium]|nr:hypothetical protein [Acidobacteriota bacterium]
MDFLRRMSRRDWFLLAGSAAARLPAQSPADLAAGFANPPLAARPSCYWVWLNGVTDRARLTFELEEMRAKGMSGVFIFEVGARGQAAMVPPGQAYWGPQSIQDVAYAIREAGRVGLEAGFVTSSSWNSGGTWVPPEYAGKGLYLSELRVEGPRRFSGALPFPPVPATAPKGPDGLPAFRREVALLAVPERRLPGHEFVIELAPPHFHTINRVVLHNNASDGPPRLAKDFSVSASDTSSESEAFREIVHGSLEARAGAQEFRFPPVRARYVRLLILSGHNPSEERIELGEFEVYSAEGKNVAAGRDPEDGSWTGAGILHYSSQLGFERDWMARNIHDGRPSGAACSWSSAGLPPLAIDRRTIADLSGRIDAQGRLEWDVPPGKWVLLRFVCANNGEQLKVASPNSQGLAIDHFSAEATRFHMRYMMDLLKAEIGDFSRTALKYMYSCSYEVQGSIWTGDLPEQFRRRRGYDLIPFLPALLGAQVGDAEVTRRFIYDFRKTLGDVLVDAYYATARQEANRYGLRLSAEAGGPGPPLHQVPVDALKALGALDTPRGEFWKRHNVWVVKETACAAHIYGKRVIEMEAFTSFRHWQDGPSDLKDIADRAFCDGANRFVFHTNPHRPRLAGQPGWVYLAGTHVGPSEVWWPMAKPFLDYLSRCSYLLQQGLFVGDVCYYYGDQGYNFVPEKRVDPSLGFGYDYDVANAEVILTRMSVRDGRIVLPDGMSYELLVLPDRDDMDLAVLEKLDQLARAGATIAGRKPVRSNGLADYPRRDADVRARAERLRIVRDKPPREILRERGIGPDFQFSAGGSQADLDYIHRRTADAEIYFVSNKQAREVSVDCVFRVRDRQAELWNPVTGEITRPRRQARAEGGTRVALELPETGSVFVVFPRRSRAVLPPLPAIASESALDGPWEVRFAEGWGAPASKTFPKLISWTEVPEEGIRYYSGIASYHKELDLEGGGPVFLDLGRVRFVAEILLNGQPLGSVWTPPFRVELTGAAKPGQNRLEVRVANTWSNRLTGDARSAGGKRYCRTNVPWSKDTPLLESGLLGPVRILTLEKP